MPSDGQKKLPAVQWYPGDWRKDPGVQSLDYYHRGVWFEVLMLMHESEDRGRLKLNGRPMPDAAAARLLGLETDQWTEIRELLLEYGVADEDEEGALICRRMVRDEDLRRKRADAGRKGGQAGAAHGSKGGRRSSGASKTEANHQAKPEANRKQEKPGGSRATTERPPSKRQAKRKQKTPPSSSSSVSTSVRDTLPPPSSGDSEGPASKQTAREDDESIEDRIARHLPRARLNIIAIHGGSEDDVEIEGHRVGVGIEIEAFRRICRGAKDPPDIIAQAIAYIPDVSELEPPVSLARWGTADGGAVYEQCVKRAYDGIPPKLADALPPARRVPEPRDAAKIAARREELREQLKQARTG